MTLEYADHYQDQADRSRGAHHDQAELQGHA